MAAERPKSRSAMQRKRSASWSVRRSLPILPFAEIYTVIDLVSIDSRGGWRESPVHLEGYRLVHDRLVGRVLRERGAPTAVLRRGSCGLPRRVGRAARVVGITAGTSALTSAQAARSSGDCVECPFHGWRWGPDGTNRYLPYHPDRPNRALRLRVYPLREQYGCVFVWHQPDGKEPHWELPDLFHKFPQFDTDPDGYYRAYPEFSRRAEHEPVHPQIVAENGPDSAHFHYVHGAAVTPVCLNWEAVDEEWRFLTGWPDARSVDPNQMALRIYSHFSGLGSPSARSRGRRTTG
jgi:hypothetical protein